MELNLEGGTYEAIAHVVDENHERNAETINAATIDTNQTLEVMRRDFHRVLVASVHPALIRSKLLREKKIPVRSIII